MVVVTQGTRQVGGNEDEDEDAERPADEDELTTGGPMLGDAAEQLTALEGSDRVVLEDAGRPPPEDEDCSGPEDEGADGLVDDSL